MRGRVGGRIGGSYRPSSFAASGIWRSSEVYSALRGVYGDDFEYSGVSWPRNSFTIYWPYTWWAGEMNYATVDESGDATFDVRVSSTPSSLDFDYYWQKSTDSGNTWEDVSGASGSSNTDGYYGEVSVTLSLSSQTISNHGDLYRLVVKASALKEVVGPSGDLRHPEAA
jgi:hypothetical protein